MPLVSLPRLFHRSWKRSPKAVAVIATELREGWVSQSSPSQGDLFTIKAFLWLSPFQPESSHMLVEWGPRVGRYSLAFLGILNVPESPVCPAVLTVLRPGLCVRWPMLESLQLLSAGAATFQDNTRSGPQLGRDKWCALFPSQHFASSSGHSRDIWGSLCLSM